MDADGDVIMGLTGTHLIQHFQDGRDGVWHTVIWPVDVVQLCQGAATLEKKKLMIADSFKVYFQNIFKSNVTYQFKRDTFTTVKAEDLHKSNDFSRR